MTASPARRPIRVLYLTETLDVGGAERQLVELATRLDRRRFEPVVCCFTAPGPLAPSLAARGVAIETLGLPRDPGLGALRGAGALWRLVRRHRPSIVHGLLFRSSVAGALVGRLAGVPVVIANRRSVDSGRAATPARRLVGRLANLLTTLVIANSEAVRRAALSRERLADTRTAVIHSGVDCARFDVPADPALRRALDLPESAPLVVVVANLLAYKGHHVFLTAWDAVLRRHAAARALLVGDGPLRRALETEVATRASGHSIRLLGSRADVPALLALADVAVQPSLVEGFPNAVLEAMAAGKPVVATAVGGTPEAVVHDGTGLLVPPGNASALAAAIVELIERPSEARAFGRAGRERAAEGFSIAATVGAYETVYERLLSTEPELARATQPVEAACRRATR